jgi:hypothetical protein
MIVAGISAKTFSRAKPRARPLAELQSSNADHMAAPFNKVASKTLTDPVQSRFRLNRYVKKHGWMYGFGIPAIRGEAAHQDEARRIAANIAKLPGAIPQVLNALRFILLSPNPPINPAWPQTAGDAQTPFPI